MCRCCYDWGLKKRREQHLLNELGRPSRSSDRQEVVQVDELNNDRLSWGKSVAVEVWSEANENWFVGKIVEASDTSSGRIVKVVYGNKNVTKSIEVCSHMLRPLVVNSVSPKPFTEALQGANDKLALHKPEIKPILYHAFISYVQKEAMDAAGILFLLLKQEGLKVWIDQQQDDISVRNMSKGVSSSCIFILFLTKSYFQKQFTVFELETALALNKQILVVWEGDNQCGPGSSSEFESYMEACPEKYKTRLFEKEALKFQRRKHLQEAQINVIAKRILQLNNSEVDIPGRQLSL